MSSFNRVIIMGNLTRDPELKHLPSGTAVSDIGIAINERTKKADQWVDTVTFVDVSLFARTAEVAAEYLSKGSSVLIEGRLKLETWEKDGQKRSKLKVVGDRMQMVGGKGNQQQSQSAAVSTPSTQPLPPSVPSDEIPF